MRARVARAQQPVVLDAFQPLDGGLDAEAVVHRAGENHPAEDLASLLRDAYMPIVAAAGAVAAGALCGFMNGVLITSLRVVPFIVTLGTMLLVRGTAKGLSDERRIEAPFTWLNGLLRTVRGGDGLLLPWGIWMLVLLAIAYSHIRTRAQRGHDGLARVRREDRLEAPPPADAAGAAEQGGKDDAGAGGLVQRGPARQRTKQPVGGARRGH